VTGPASIAVCLATDAGYAFPTAVVAKSIAQTHSANIGPVYYIWVDQDAPPRELVSYLERCGAVLVVAPTSLLLTMSRKHAQLTNAASARLALDEILKGFSIEKFLYLDGDVEIAGSLSALADVVLPESHIAAVENAGTLMSRRSPIAHRKWVERIRDLGMPEGSPYFNSGVILAHMKSWTQISAQARVHYAAHAGKCRHFDQCALNAVCHDRRLALSPRWNFQHGFFGLNVEGAAASSPRVVHFSGVSKPWAPVLFSRTWAARKPHFVARSEMPELWRKTARPTKWNAYKRTLLNYINRAACRIDAQRVFSHYLANTEFADIHRS
jgi:lipopolysaccharide biosynthesis glycosyltransferase